EPDQRFLLPSSEEGEVIRRISRDPNPAPTAEAQADHKRLKVAQVGAGGEVDQDGLRISRVVQGQQRAAGIDGEIRAAEAVLSGWEGPDPRTGQAVVSVHCADRAVGASEPLNHDVGTVGRPSDAVDAPGEVRDLLAR